MRPWPRGACRPLVVWAVILVGVSERSAVSQSVEAMRTVGASSDVGNSVTSWSLAASLGVSTTPSWLTGTWGPWSPWSACSRSCGTGVAVQTRECHRRARLRQKAKTDKKHRKRRERTKNEKDSKRKKNRVVSTQCVGQYKRVHVCNEQECPDRSRDFRAEQCESYNRRNFSGYFYHWEPFLSAPEPCQLNCRPRGFRFYATLNQTAVDGTSCAPPSSSGPSRIPSLRSERGPRWLCVSGMCQRVGCDGVVGSGARADACGACGGDNSTCSEARTVSGIFTRPTLPKGLNVVAVLPQGACNLSVAQLRPTKNLLSLRRLNGGPLGRGAPRPGDKHGVYETAGARFTYTPADPLRGFGESLSAAGPLGEPLELMLLYLQPNPGIKYEYTLPVVRREFGAAGAPPTALALPLALTTTLPPPRDAPRDPADNEVLDDARDVRHALGQDVVSVESETRPPTELRGKSRRYVWRVTGLSECSKSCGGGTQQAVVQCVRENSLLPVSEKRCQGQERLASYAVRCGSRPCPAQWVTGDWSGCSVTCGTGTQTRELSCRQEISSTLAVRVADGACLGPKPEEATMQACRMPPCHHHSHRNHHHVAVPRPPPPAPLDLQATPTAPAEPSRASWTVGPWSRCSAECGRGLRTRSVSCPATPRGASNGALHVASCPDGERPADQEACDAGPCGAAAAAGASHTGQAAPFWLASEWSSRCSAQCGAGVQSRLVTCSAGSAGPAGPCDARLRPAHTRACSAEAAGPAGCPGQWFASPWGPCSASCGQGAQSRGVACVQWQRGEARYQVQDDDFCEAHLRPESQQPCAERACPAHWFAGEWSECSRSCGPGAQKREVRCVGPSGPSTMCSEDSKLPTRKPCHLQDCGSPRALAPSSSSPETQDDPADSAFACEDRLRNCHLVVQARLCKYAYYGTSCCHSCRRKVE